MGAHPGLWCFKPQPRKGLPMAHSTVPTASPATAVSEEFMELVAALLPQLLLLFAVRQAFRQQPPTPQLTYAFEHGTSAILRETGRVLLEQEYNHIEPQQLQDCPQRLRLGGQEGRWG